MKDSISPEEKLLKLIRGKQKENKIQESQPRLKVLDTKKELTPQSYPVQNYSTAPYIKKIIYATFLVACLYLIFSFLYPWVGFKKPNLTEIESQESPDIKTEPQFQQTPVEFYLKDIQDRQIFSGSATQPQIEKPLASVSQDFIKDLKLVGIISGDKPQAVIEDKKAEQTYYLSQGQSFGELTVEDIKEGKVILNYRGYKFELYL